MSRLAPLPIVAIRPEPGLSATREAAQAQGIAVIGAPLFVIVSRAWAAPDANDVDGVLLGSANALRHGGAALDAFLGKQAYVVGEATAQAARNAGFVVETVGSGGLQAVLDMLSGQSLRLLRLAGEDHVTLAPPQGISIVTRIVYKSEPCSAPAELVEQLRGGGVIMLHSAEAARHFRSECIRLRIAPGKLRIAALGPRILAAAGEGWEVAKSAQNPREGELLALAHQLCH